MPDAAPLDLFLDRTIQDVAINTLKPARDNPRVDLRTADSSRFSALKESIKRGIFKPILVIGSTLEVVAGHQRLEACRDLHIRTVPVLFLKDLTDAQKKMIRIQDNHAAGFDSIPLLREQIADLPPDDLPLLGLDQVTLSNLDLTPLGDAGGDAGGVPVEEDRFATLKVKMTREDFDFVDQWIKRVCKRDRCKPGAVIARVFTEWSQDPQNQIEEE